MTQAQISVDEGWPPGVTPPPRGEDLPYDDGEPMESDLHRAQMDMCCDYGDQLLAGRDAYVAGNMALYYSALQAKVNDFRAPDVMFVLDVSRRMRKSWVIWEEDGRRPDVVIELLSDSTRAVDLGRKKDIYERVLGVHEYFCFDPWTGELLGWRLGGRGYEAIAPDAEGRLGCERLGVKLGLALGEYRSKSSRWLRFFRPDGSLVPTEAEAERAKAEAERAKAEAERAKAEAEHARAERLAAELAALKAELAARG